jgi:hypothetical protein
MSANNYHLFLFLLVCVLLWQLVSGRALGVWWRPNVTRKDNPRTYWVFVAAQAIIFIGILATGIETWNFR